MNISWLRQSIFGKFLLILAALTWTLGANCNAVWANDPNPTPNSVAEESPTAPQPGQFVVQLRYQTEIAPGNQRWHRLTKSESWQAAEMAVVVCDMWDSHHCVNAVRRVGELTPRMNALLTTCRQQGVTIIHAPSGCMNAYADHPARLRATQTKPSPTIPQDIAQWRDKIDSESSCPYPLDQSAGGEDDDLVEHQQWAATMAAAGLNPRTPWTKQCAGLTIDAQRDYISDSGTEIWSILEERGIKHIALVGVHTNMCVLGRPFGLRQLASHGKQVALIRDMTDTMYDPRCWPYVSHFSGTDLIVDHIERLVCSTFTSSDILGGQEFRFAQDHRPTLAMLIAEDEYETEKSLPDFAAVHLGGYRVQCIYGDATERANIPAIDQIASADALLISVRRRTLPAEQLSIVRAFIDSGKPVIGIRTASHAFSLRNKSPENGLADWPQFDAEVWGGSYTNHYGNELQPKIYPTDKPAESALAQSLKNLQFVSGGSLYQVMPLGPGTSPLLMGAIEGKPAEPVAWTNVRSGGGRAFYTSLGHKRDFQQAEFRLLLANGIHWACNQPLVSLEDIQQQQQHFASGQGKQR